MGWKNQVICQLKANVQAPYGGGALFFVSKDLSHDIKDTSLVLINLI